jgi:hypothetical protein
VQAMTDAELRWLDYARHVVNVSAAHIQLCESQGGVPDVGDTSRTLRWPGYIGRRYREGEGVLCINQVHRDINAETEQISPDVNQRYVEATSNWRAGRLSDADFLGETRRAYEYWIPRWAAWKHFRYLVEQQLGLRVDEVVYANLAKCQLSTGRATTGVVRSCQTEFPICELVMAIRPRVVLCARADAYEGGPTVREWCTPNVFTFNFRTGERDGEPRSVWGPRMAGQFDAVAVNDASGSD